MPPTPPQRIYYSHFTVRIDFFFFSSNRLKSIPKNTHFAWGRQKFKTRRPRAIHFYSTLPSRLCLSYQHWVSAQVLISD